LNVSDGDDVTDRRDALARVRKVADYQFDGIVGTALFPDRVEIRRSKQTGKVRHVYLDGELLATMKAQDGLYALTVKGGERLKQAIQPPRIRVVVTDDVVQFISAGRDTFARHVIAADEAIRPGEEVLVVDTSDHVLAVGKAALTGSEMSAFKRGVAVKVRRGRGETRCAGGTRGRRGG
jgi:predicted RNA-binding protein (TIGR00451 family)